MKLDLKESINKSLQDTKPTYTALNTAIGTINMAQCGKVVTLSLQAVGSGKGTTSLATAGIPAPINGHYALTWLYYGSTAVANLQFLNGSWAFNRTSGSNACYGSITYIMGGVVRSLLKALKPLTLERGWAA